MRMPRIPGWMVCARSAGYPAAAARSRYGTIGAPAAGPVACATGGREFVASPFGGNNAEAARGHLSTNH